MQYNLLRHLIQFAADNLPRVRGTWKSYHFLKSKPRQYPQVAHHTHPRTRWRLRRTMWCKEAWELTIFNLRNIPLESCRLQNLNYFSTRNVNLTRIFKREDSIKQGNQWSCRKQWCPFNYWLRPDSFKRVDRCCAIDFLEDEWKIRVSHTITPSSLQSKFHNTNKMWMSQHLPLRGKQD